MIYQRVVVIYQRIFLPVRAFLKSRSMPGSGRKAERACAAAGFNACRRTAFFPHGGPACAGKGSRAPVRIRSRCALRAGVPVVQSAGSASGLFLPQKGLFLRGWGCCPGFHDGKKGHFLTRLYAEGTESAWGAPLRGEGIHRTQVFAGHRLLFSCREGASHTIESCRACFLLTRGGSACSALQGCLCRGFFTGEGSCGRHPGAGG